MSQFSISAKSYTRFREYLEKQCGIILGENKQYLVQSRMGKILRDAKQNDFDQFLNELFAS